MALLFGVRENNITYHIKDIYRTNELTPESTAQKIRVVRNEGGRQVRRAIDFYNLDMIISVGYRVNSANATQFRRWATQVLKNYLLRGIVINEKLSLLREEMNARFHEQQRILDQHQEQIDFFVRTNLPPVEQVFFEGDFFEARVLLEKLIKLATKRIVVIDHYIDASNFAMLDARGQGVKATIYSHRDYADLRDMHNAQAGVQPIETVVWSKPSHDRWLIIDDEVYHCGHSLKDMGRKMSAITRMGVDAESILSQVQ